MNDSTKPLSHCVFNISHPQHSGFLYAGLMSVGKFAETAEDSMANVRSIPVAMEKFKKLFMANLTEKRTPIEAAMKARHKLVRCVPESTWLIFFVHNNDIVELSY